MHHGGSLIKMFENRFLTSLALMGYVASGDDNRLIKIKPLLTNGNSYFNIIDVVG